MLSRWCPRLKWRNHVAPCIYPVEMLKIDLQLKRSFFKKKTIRNFHLQSFCVFFFDPIKRSTKVQKSQSTPGTSKERTVARRILDKIKERWRPHIPDYTKTAYSLPTHVTHCGTNNKPATYDQLTLTQFLILIWWKKRASQERLTPAHLLTSIWWKKRSCISSGVPTFI